MTESKLSPDQRTGAKREADIIIETTAGIHPLVIGIECIDHNIPGTVPWIEEIFAKHQDLLVNKSIAVSRSGFAKTALKKAKSLKIETLTLDEASELDWVAISNGLQTI